MHRILVPTDGSQHAKAALKVACDLARANDAQLLLFHVLLRKKEAKDIIAMPEFSKLDAAIDEELRDVLKRAPLPHDVAEVMADPDAPDRPAPAQVLEALGEVILNAATAECVTRGIAARRLKPGDGEPAAAILDAARTGDADTIVMGSRGLGELEAFTFGSVSHKVARDSVASVISVHAGPGSRPE
jgi:nucleotide-binding universal stress UspA family protein